MITSSKILIVMIEDHGISHVVKPGTFNPTVSSPLRHIVTYENVVPEKPIDLAIKYDEAQTFNSEYAKFNENKERKLLTVIHNKQGHLASRKAERRKISNSSNEDEVYFELSPQLPSLHPALSLKHSDYDIFEYEQVSQFQESLNYELRNLMPVDNIVEVSIKPMGRPLAANSQPIRLDLLPLPEMVVKNILPFCGVIDESTWAILNLLEYEIKRVGGEEKEKLQGWLERLKVYYFGYKDEDSYFERYPWARFAIKSSNSYICDTSDD